MRGKLTQNGSTYIPDIFTKAQEETIAQFFNQNSYISIEMLQRLGISKPESYLEKSFNNGVLLQSVFVSNAAVETVSGAVEEALNEQGT